ncbi:diacylglycerol/lipid kinase family protein [Phytoactinopolyspora endophytica]|uniref:diacylglycerol/lipid kinase family protein n=1 Tax=Phytoactinopolyspora endophytica TaxID=1642495 RepID=UPI00101D4481|nr:diacylglycerol kinase family protein [Phytoactinopolyspora endophytica]
MRTFTAVVNPHAGTAGWSRRAVAARLHPVLATLSDLGAKVTIEQSRSLEHAVDLATVAAERGDVVLAAGGDGTVGALAAAVIRAEGVLGVIPVGRGNDFARQLSIPAEPSALATLLHDAEPSAVDVIDVEGTVVVGSMYAGIDAVANGYFNQARVLGGAGYHYAALRALAGWRMVSYRVTIDGTRHDVRGYTVVVANSGYFGNGRHAAPDARVDDGLLDVIVLTDVSRRAFIAIAMRELYTGVHVNRPEVLVFRGREVSVEAGRTMPVGGDGELIGTLPATARVLPGALRVLSGHQTS